MWEYEHSVETRAPADALWRRWSDMAAWPEWNHGIEKIEIDGPFAVGTKFTMTPPDDDPLRCESSRSFRASCSPMRWTPATSLCVPFIGWSGQPPDGHG
jgi:Polyketide cyclase / dehydrase and lipid transport